MERRLLYLENDVRWMGLVEPLLHQYGQITVVDNEHDFRIAIDRIAISEKLPSAVILEQVIRWTFPSREMPEPPAEVLAQGSRHAGVRCYSYLRQAQEGHRKTPVIFYSAVPLKAISDHLLNLDVKDDYHDYQCVDKDAELEELHRALRRVL